MTTALKIKKKGRTIVAGGMSTTSTKVIPNQVRAFQNKKKGIVSFYTVLDKETYSEKVLKVNHHPIMWFRHDPQAPIIVSQRENGDIERDLVMYANLNSIKPLFEKVYKEMTDK